MNETVHSGQTAPSTVTPARGPVAFTRMDDATPEEVAFIVDQAQTALQSGLVDTIVGLLDGLRGEAFGYQVDRYEHSLQTASRALREGARTDMVVAALLHDIGDAMAPANHSQLAAAILRPYLDAEATWVVEHHGVFQGYHYWHKMGLDRDARDRYRGHPWFDSAAHFCAAWDQESFDPDYPTLPLSEFMPLVREVFSRPASGFSA